MIEFAFAVSLWIIEAVVNQLELIQRRIDVHAGHDPNTLDELFGIVAVLASHQFDRKGSDLAIFLWTPGSLSGLPILEIPG